MDVTRERFSRILELREILLSFQTDFSLVSAAVVCAIPESISGLDPSSVINEPRYLKLVTVSSFCPFTLISVLMPLVLFAISLARSGELRTQKLKFHLVRTQSLNVLLLKPGVGQYIAMHATLTARDFFLAYVYPSSPFTCIFSKPLPIFPVLAVANTWFLCRLAK